MKKIFMIFVAGAALALSSCNNAEEVKKQTEEQDAKITALVDEKLAGLQTQVDEECAALVADSATAAYETWYATEGKKKGAPKPVAKPKPKPVAPVKVDPKKDPSSTTNRPGASTSTEVKTSTDRPGATTNDQPKKTSDRPGATTKPN